MSRSSLGIVWFLGAAVAWSVPGALTRAEGEGHGAPPADAVEVAGSIFYTGPLPKPILVVEAGAVRHPIEVDPKTKGLKDAVVWLEGVPASRPQAPAPTGPARIDQVNYFFVPHVLAVQAGREVEFTNSDPANHGVSAASFEPKNSFNIVTPPGGRYTHRFLATKRPVAIGCPFHTAMAAWVVIFEHSYHDVTDAEGAFHLPAVPPGRYRLHVRHLDSGMVSEQAIVARPDGTAPLRVEFGRDDLKAGVAKTPRSQE